MILGPLSLALGGFALATLLYIVRTRSSQIYDLFILKMTTLWYRTVLGRLPDGATLLDIGVGNASSLLANADILQTKSIRVFGVDFTQAYVQAAQTNISQSPCASTVKVVYGSVYDQAVLETGHRWLSSPQMFSAAYFSGSISLLPDPLLALRTVAKVVEPGGKIYVTQTYQKRGLPALAVLKRNLKYLTTIDFGELTWEADIRRVFQESGFAVDRHEVIRGSVDNWMQSAYLTVLKVP